MQLQREASPGYDYFLISVNFYYRNNYTIGSIKLFGFVVVLNAFERSFQCPFKIKSVHEMSGQITSDKVCWWESEMLIIEHNYVIVHQ